MILGYIIIIDTSWKLRIDIVIVKVAWSAQRYAEICIESVCAPEGSSTTFDFNMVQPAYNAGSFVSIQSDSKC